MPVRSLLLHSPYLQMSSRHPRHEPRVQTNLRLTQHARNVLAHLSETYGLSQADIVELLLRKAEQENTLTVLPANGHSRHYRAG